MNYWLVKQEPEKYSFDDLLKDKKTIWDGVRNYQALNNLQAMKRGDKVLYDATLLGELALPDLFVRSSNVGFA